MNDVVKESGALFYSPPDKMDQWVDPLMRPICEAINTSGWVWTAESCQGHPDATTSGTWGENTNPMIRLVTKDPGGTMHALFRAFKVAAERTDKRPDLFEIHGFRAYPTGRGNDGWTEILVYIDAKTTFQRDQALDVWGAFAELVVENKVKATT